MTDCKAVLLGTKTSRSMAAAGQERKTRRRMLMFPVELGLVIRWPGRRVQERLRAAGSGKHGFRRREYFYMWTEEESLEAV